jgi:hypothetical protein
MADILYVIQGTVIDNYGTNVGGVTVTIKYQNDESSTKSDSSGQFVFDSNTTPFIKGADNSLITLTFTKDKFKSFTLTPLPAPTISAIETVPDVEGPNRVTLPDGDIQYVYKVGDKEFKSTSNTVAKGKADNYQNELRVNQNKQITDLSGGDEIQLEEDIISPPAPQTPQIIIIKGKITDSSGSPLPNTSIKYAISPEIIFSEKEKQPIEFESGKGDDFLYKKDGNKFYYKGKPNTVIAKKFPDWVEQTKDVGVAAIKAVYEKYKIEEIAKLAKSSPLVSSLETISNPQGEYELKIEPTNFSPLGQVSYNLDNYQSETKSNLAINNNGTYVLNITLIPLANSVETQSKQAENEIQKQELEDLKNNLKAEIPTEEQLRKLLEQKKKTIIQILIPTLISLLLAFGVNAISNALSTKCPSSSFLKRIIRIRNNSAATINGIYNTIKIANFTLAGTQVLLTSIQIGITAAEANTVPTPAKIANTLVESKSRVRTLLGINTAILFTISGLGIYLGVIKSYMDKLDTLIQRCSEDEQIPFTEINNAINLQSPPPQSTDVNTYKGFTYEVVLDLSNNSPYPKRYAQALNKQNVPVLRTESSFASDAKVLVDQLKFIIDSNPNLTAG